MVFTFRYDSSGIDYNTFILEPHAQGYRPKGLGSLTPLHVEVVEAGFLSLFPSSGFFNRCREMHDVYGRVGG